ncbi:MAG: hypothetical protein JOZ45_10095, partial [Acidobacteriaceae bacterium]|nr:hypothetical protein [Acidobacteriaceae bacterium]
MSAFLRQPSPLRNFFLLLPLYACLTLPSLGQSEMGELRLYVKDSAGASVGAKVQLTNQATN